MAKDSIGYDLHAIALALEKASCLYDSDVPGNFRARLLADLLRAPAVMDLLDVYDISLMFDPRPHTETEP